MSKSDINPQVCVSGCLEIGHIKISEKIREWRRSSMMSTIFGTPVCGRSAPAAHPQRTRSAPAARRQHTGRSAGTNILTPGEDPLNENPSLVALGNENTSLVTLGKNWCGANTQYATAAHPQRTRSATTAQPQRNCSTTAAHRQVRWDEHLDPK